MDRSSIEFDIGFADGEVLSYEKRSDVLTVVVKAWNEKLIYLKFSGVVRVLDNDAGDIEDVCQVRDETDFYRAAIDQVYDIFPRSIPYGHFQFVRPDGVACLEVIAESIEVSRD